MVLTYALIGIVMSIYRYKDVYPNNVVDRVNIKNDNLCCYKAMVKRDNI